MSIFFETKEQMEDQYKLNMKNFDKKVNNMLALLS